MVARGILGPESYVQLLDGEIIQMAPPRPLHSTAIRLVADASLEFDRSRKQAVCARAAVPEYWILDLADRLEVCRDPDPGAGVYRRRQVLAPADEVTPTSFPAVRLPVSALLP
jgi:Uma2 family endonuclease